MSDDKNCVDCHFLRHKKGTHLKAQCKLGQLPKSEYDLGKKQKDWSIAQQCDLYHFDK